MVLTLDYSNSSHLFARFQNDETVETVAGTMRRYVFGVLRFIESAYPEPIPPTQSHTSFVNPVPVNLPPFKLTQLQVHRGQKLRRYIEEDYDGEACRLLLHEFLYEMLAFDHPAAREKAEYCTMTKIMVFISIRQDLRFKEYGTLSTSAGHIQWCTRGVYMMEMVRLGDENQVDGCSDYIR